MKEVHTAGGIIVRKQNQQIQVLLIKHEDGFLAFPKGHIKPGERAPKAAVREVAEETGLSDLEIITKLGEVIRQSREGTGELVEKIIELFLMKSTTMRHGEAEEEYGWFTYKQAISQLGFKQEKAFLIQKWQTILQNSFLE